MNDRAIIEAAIAADESGQPFGAGKEPGEQGSIEWLMERVGMITASRFKDAIDFTDKGKSSAKRDAYMWEVVIERITGKPFQHYENAAMQHGNAMEPLARMAYCAKTGAFVEEVGFSKHPDHPKIGGSPDGLIEEDGGIEIKCPFNSANHLICFLSGIPEEHIPQMQGLMWVKGRQWWDFVSSDPRLPEPLNLYIKRLHRDDKWIDEVLEPRLLQFSEECLELEKRLRAAA